MMVVMPSNNKIGTNKSTSLVMLPLDFCIGEDISLIRKHTLLIINSIN